MNKNKFSILICTIFCLLTNIALTQSSVEYYYDNAGNRIQRVVIDISGISTQNNNNNANPIEDMAGDYEFKLYPNTTESMLTVEAEPEFMELKDKKIYVYDMKGQLLLEKDYLNNSERLDLSNFAVGSYLVNVRADNGYFAEWRVLKR